MLDHSQLWRRLERRLQVLGRWEMRFNTTRHRVLPEILLKFQGQHHSCPLCILSVASAEFIRFTLGCRAACTLMPVANECSAGRKFEM